MDVRMALALALTAGLPACAQQAEPEVPRQPGVAVVAPALNLDDADDLLRELEKADAGIRLLHADVVYDKTFEIAGDRQVRYGQLWFVSPEPAEGRPARRRFAITFDRAVIGDRQHDERMIYVFDGEWFVEKLPAQKLMIKRQVVPPGEDFDPLKIGEGPLPIPIGQKRDDIVKAFEATLVPAADGLAAPDNASEDERLQAEALIEVAQGSKQLRLVPRPNADQAEDFEEIRIWYAHDSDARLLPKMARTVSTEGNISIVQLLNVTVNPPQVPPDDLFHIETPPDGWRVQTMPWRGG